MLRQLALPLFVAIAVPVAAEAQRLAPSSDERLACERLIEMPRLTVTYAVLKPATASVPQHCYMQGLLSGRIRFHMQLPLRTSWNGRLLNIGNGGKAGNLRYADDRVAQGYAVANSNTGHDSAAEPGASFAHENLQAVIDFGYRAVHLTANASKAVVRAYYGQPARHTYFHGCSTGGRQGLMAAQRFPADFDAILAGAPVYDYAADNITDHWMSQKAFEDNFAGNLAFDKDRDGTLESLTKLDILREAVLNKCDAIDGVKDGVIDHPPSCDFNPDTDLATDEWMCLDDVNGDACFTRRQLQTIKDFYRGPYDSQGVSVSPGHSVGSEWGWGSYYFLPENLPGDDHMNFLFYEVSPGMPMPGLASLTQRPDKSITPPEYAWWEFDVDEYTAGKGQFMMNILDATDPDLTRFLIRENGKLILYHGWADPGRQSQPTVDYYDSVVEKTFDGNLQAAQEKIRLFMIPGMGHCRGGPGLGEWDGLPALVEWLEQEAAPRSIVGQHRTDGIVDNRRPVCTYPEQAVYTGPAGGQNDPANWIESNFSCR